MNNKILFTWLLLCFFLSRETFAQNTWYGLSSTLNVCKSGPFEFRVKKLTPLTLSAKQKEDLQKSGVNLNTTRAMELEYEIKNTSTQKQEIKGVFRFPSLYSKETGSYKPFHESGLSFGNYYMEGYMANAPGAKDAYNKVYATSLALSKPYEPGEIKLVRYFVYLIPNEAKTLMFWLTPTGCSSCQVQLKTSENVGCELKL